MSLSISVVTPSYNQAEFLPRAIASVAAQTHAPVEHLIYDPGSCDASRDIARAAPTVTLIAEPDKGQADAVARGMAEAKGDIVAWLNSDDEYYDEGVFADVAEAFQSEASPDIVFGGGDYVGRDGEFLRSAYVVKRVKDLSWRLAMEVGILQPAAFISKSLIERIGPVDPSLHFCMDYDFWIRAQKAGARFVRLERKLAKARYYADNKTMGQRGASLREVALMVKKHYGFAHYRWLERLADFEVHGSDGVLRHHVLSGFDKSALSRRLAELNRRINGDNATASLLASSKGERLYGATPLLFKYGAVDHAAAYARPIDEDAKPVAAERNYKVGPQKWAFDRKWLDAALDRSDRLFARLAAERSGDTCLILGNGPSLKKVDLKSLAGVDAFVTNYAVFNKDVYAIAKYLCVTNYLVAEQECERFNLIEDKFKFIPYWLSYCMTPGAETAYVRSVGKPEFGTDIRQNISWRSTVSFFAMQIAYALGYRKVLLAGFDHHYIQPDLREGALIDQDKDDQNHFDSGYFKGKTWQAADTMNMEAMYRLAKAAFEADGREIVNCTVGGHLELFRRADLDAELDLERAAQRAQAEALSDEHTRLAAALPADLGLPLASASAPPRKAEIEALRRVVELYRRDLDETYRPRLSALRGATDARRCFILLDDGGRVRTAAAKLADEVVFVAGRALALSGAARRAPTYAVAMNADDARANAEEPVASTDAIRLVPAWLRGAIEPDDATLFFDHRRGGRGNSSFFSQAEHPVFYGETPALVSLELAVSLGFEEICFVGGGEAFADEPDLRQAYEHARRACDEGGLRVFDATVGGDKGIFPHASLLSLLEGAAAPPRLLLIDHTRIGDGTATGEVKAALLADWPADRLLQLSVDGRERLVLSSGDRHLGLSADDPLLAPVVWSRIAAFDPEIILYRPAPNTDRLHALAMDIINGSGLPYAVWIMDDWPTAFAATDQVAFARLETDWRRLVSGAVRRFSIGDAMSKAFETRYGARFESYANGVDPDTWPRPGSRRAGLFRLRYAGSLSEIMTLEALRLVAEAVEKLAADGHDIVFEIKTRPLWRRRAAPRFEGLAHTRFIVANMTAKDYRAWLSGADAVVIAYNFDDKSKAYVRYSVANKLPECMACGAPILAVGPAEVATLAYLEECGCSQRADESDAGAVARALQELIESPSLRLELAEKAQNIAFERHNVRAIRTSFMQALSESLQAETHIGALPRDACAQVDETAVIARLLADRRGKTHVMLDVGAHVGSSAAYFHKLGWTIHCFEPDPGNRKKLIRRFARARNITIDARALSDRPMKAAAFFTSAESSGISGLHAFRATHEESARVEVTTIADVVEARGLSHIDFLKIDVEGLDLSVLKGAPWERWKPDVVECEFEDAKTVPLGHTWRDIADFLRDRGYAVYVSEWHPITRYGVPHDWRRVAPYPGVDIPAEAWGNLLAFREDPGYEAVRRAFFDLVETRRPETGQQQDAAAPLPAQPAPETASAIAGAYTRLAHNVNDVSPRLYGVLRFFKRALMRVWARKTVTAPILLILIAMVAASLHPAFAPLRYALWAACAGAVIALGGVYLAFRLHMIAERVAHENAALRQQLATMNAKAGDRERDLQRKLAATDARFTASARNAAEKTAALRGELVAVKSNLVAATAAIREIRPAVKTLKTTLAEVSATFEQNLKQRYLDLDRRLKEQNARVSVTPPNNARFYQRFSRQLELEHIEEVRTVWQERLSLTLTRQMLGYMAHRACQVETMLQGRVATSIEDILLRTVVAKSVKRPELDILEIGTLFGVGAAIMHDALAPHFEAVRFTLLDPLEGYYAATQNDILTGLPVNEDILRRNFERAGMEEAAFTLIKRLSSEDEAVIEARRRQYDILIIDGDHSYDGVKTDFTGYAPMVRVGGYIIFDDYGSADWPDVKRYVDAEMPAHDFVEHVGTSWRTCVYRIVDKA